MTQEKAAIARSAVDGTGRLSMIEKIGYSFGDAGSNFYWKVFEFYLLYFYTDVFGISPGAAATMFLAARVWDAVNDPMMGAIADRTRTRWGRFRPYLLWGPLPLAVAGVLTFTTPDLDDGGKLIYAWVTYFFMMMAYTAINIPYSALMGVLTSDSQERTSVSSIRFIAAFTVGLFVQSYTQELAEILGKGDEAKGWQLVMVVYGIAAALLFVLTFFLTKERVQPSEAQELNFREELKDVIKNKPWLLLFFLGFAVLSMLIVRGSSIIYYFEYVVGDKSQFSSFMFLGGLAGLAGIAVTPVLSRVFGKPKLYMIAVSGALLINIAFYFAPPSETVLIFGLNIAFCFILGPTAPIIWAMYADTADYGEWKFGRRATGLVFSAATLSQKLGVAVAVALAGFLLQYVGYDAELDNQNEEAVHGILLLMSLIPAGFAILSLAIMSFYKLDNDTMAQIEADLKERRENG